MSGENSIALEALETIAGIIPPAKSVGNGTAYDMWKQTHDIARKAIKKIESNPRVGDITTPKSIPAKVSDLKAWRTL